VVVGLGGWCWRGWGSSGSRGCGMLGPSEARGGSVGMVGGNWMMVELLV